MPKKIAEKVKGKKERKLCDREACDRPAIALGLCARHYERDRRGAVNPPAKKAAAK